MQEQEPEPVVAPAPPSSDATCRVCRGPATPEQPLYYPCQCKGSIRWVHQDCLLDWLQHSRLKSCELCKHQFRFTPIYAPGAPEHLSMFALFVALWRRCGSSAMRALRAALVLHIWVVAVPLLSSLIGRFYLARLPPLPRLLSTVWLLRETLFGVTLVSCILGLYMALTHLVRYLRLLRLERQIMVPPGAGAAPVDADEDMVFDLFDAPPGNAVAGEPAEPEEGELDDLLGLAGPWHRLLSAAFYVIAFNAGVLALLFLIPNLLGLSALLLWHKDAAPAPRAYSELVQLGAGYAVLALVLLLVASVSTALPAARNSPPFRAVRALLELLGIAVKVGALCATELGVFPIICGTMVLRAISPICSTPLVIPPLPLSIAAAAGRWGVGLAYMISIGSVVRSLREQLRPGALWFLRNPETAAVLREMIELPLWRHVRRLFISTVFYAALVSLQVAIPALLLRYCWPLSGSVLTGAFSVTLLQVDTYASRWYYAALVVLHLVSPYLLPVLRPAASFVFEYATRQLCHITGLGSYLLPGPEPAPLAAAVPRFTTKLLTLLSLVGVCLTCITMAGFAVLLLGKCMLQTLGPDWLQANDVPAFLIGLYSISAVLHLAIFLRRLTALPPLGHSILSGAGLVLRVAIATVSWGVLLPLLAGLVLDRTLQPLRFRPAASSVHVIGHLWLLGFVWLKIWARVILVTRPGRFRPVIERILHDGFTALNLSYFFSALILPLTAYLSLFLCLPYALCSLLVPLFTRRLLLQAAISQCSHLALIGALLLVVGVQAGRSWLAVLHEEVRNERYLVGAALHNYAAEEHAAPAPEMPAQ